MKICNKEFRIVEKIYGDGRAEYHAEKILINLFFIKIWSDYTYKTEDYGYAKINFKYRFDTYDKCLKYLTENVSKQYKLMQSSKVIKKNIFK